jgi:uncharacterized protein (TIRG00374 family)
LITEKLKKTIIVLVKLLITIGLLFLAFNNIDFARFGIILKQANYSLLLLSVFLYGMTFVFGAIRWKTIIEHLGQNAPILFCIRSYFISGFFSQVVIGGGYGGDLYRVWDFGQRINNKFKSFVTVLIDRVSGLVFSVLCVVVLSPVYIGTFSEHSSLFVTIFLIAVSIVLVFYLLLFFGGVLSPKKITLNNFLQKAARNFFEVHDSLRLSFANLPNAFTHLWWSFMALLVNLLGLSAIGFALNIDISVGYYLLLGPLVFLAKSFPLSIAGWGAREVAVIYFFGMLGVDSESALALSLVAGLIVLVAALPGIVLWLSSKSNKIAT